MTTVMVVEDNTELLENIAIDLEMRGYEVMQAANGTRALDVLHASENAPDIIVSDIAMPEMNGYELLENVQANPPWAGIPFIFLTAFGSRNAVRMGKELGADDYIVKPFEYEDLAVAIENKLRRFERFRADAEENLDKARRELIQLISHELRTPLTTIYGGTEMLAESLRSLADEETRNLLSLVRTGTKRMNRLISRVLTVVQIDSGHYQRVFAQSSQPCDLSAVVRAGAMTARDSELLVGKSVSLNMEGSDERLVVRGVYDLLATIFEELTRNALAFSAHAGVVMVRVLREGDRAVISVHDNGPGIPEGQMQRVWERFVQLDRDQYEQQGTGLGLPIVDGLVALHGGNVYLESSVQNGTTAYVVLPLLAGPFDDDADPFYDSL